MAARKNIPLAAYKQALEGASSASEAARTLGVDRAQVLRARDKLLRLREDALVHPDLSPEALAAAREKRFAAQHGGAVSIETVKVPIRGPIGILHFGDPHLDDDGTDIGAIRRHLELIRDTEGLYAGNIGDLTNNWVGALTRLYADQSTSQNDAWKLVEWFTAFCPDKWMYFLTGNHDDWNIGALKYIAKMNRIALDYSGARLLLRFPNGRELRINARHQFQGSSIYNPAHAPLRNLLFNTRDHITIQGHIHQSGHSVWKDAETGRACHALVVASYKRYDNLARSKGLRDNMLSPCVVTVIDPALPEDHPDFVTVFWTPEAAVPYLQWRRQQWRK